MKSASAMMRRKCFSRSSNFLRTPAYKLVGRGRTLYLAYINQHEGRHRSIVFQDTRSPFQCTCRRHLLLPPQYLGGCHKREQEEGNTNGRHAAGNYENNATSPDLGSHDREIYIQPPLQIRANTCTVADSIYLTFGAHKVALVNAQARRKRTQGPAFRVC